MAQQLVKKVIRLFIIATGVISLYLLLLSSPVLAESIVSSPSIIEMEMLPGTTARILLSVENRADTISAFHFAINQPAKLEEGYTNFPDFSWLDLSIEDIELASGEQSWAIVYLSIPDDESLREQKWQANINVISRDWPILSSSYILLVSVGEAAPGGINWGMIGIIAAVSAIAITVWNRWQEQRRIEWATGLRTKHWLAY